MHRPTLLFSCFRRARARRPSSVLCGGVLALLAMQGCQRTVAPTLWEPAGPATAVYVEDNVLISRVKAALMLSPLQTSMHIGVNARQGVVLLSGRVDDATERDLAVFVAQSVRGVHKVDSFIFVPGTTYAAAEHVLRDEGLDVPLHDREGGRESGWSDGTFALSSPLPPQDDSQAKDGKADTPPISAMKGLAYRILGIGSIQDELRIKP